MKMKGPRRSLTALNNRLVYQAESRELFLLCLQLQLKAIGASLAAITCKGIPIRLNGMTVSHYTGAALAEYFIDDIDASDNILDMELELLTSMNALID
ncbi:hypothetical protein L1987_13657 [Smallanthus sonchifolius]|uniref:Uncharacterized protein n=1 Tax=Smallanthus sonchifolius TaxID=185202 RepID=A0ACB9JJ69_9ASTR|nr:hypothetical protein L1987_13657 [Smallanthus sonchifolius]